MYKQIEKEILSLRNSDKAKILQWFFKTGKWDYGDWDVFLWITMPEQRNIVKKYFKEVSFEDVQKLLESKYHEFRMVWLLFLVAKYEKFKFINRNNNLIPPSITKKLVLDTSLIKGGQEQKFADELNKSIIPPTPLPKGGCEKEIFDFYVKNLKYVNNWDLVDVTCPKIVWDYLLDKDKSILYDFAKSENMWIQRIAIISTMSFIKNWFFDDTIELSKILLSHKHDLIHKAVWWMLREIWKKDESVLIKFLDENFDKMSRTTLRYAIEKFDENKRRYWINK
jgi:3-methyladenine DNA glycosylase AlkD